MNITTIGIDLAKNVFAVHGMDAQGHTVLKKLLRRDQLTNFFANVPTCRVGMEACGGAHHWARQLQALGHDVRLIAPQFVKPFVKSNKNDAADAQAICEAVARPSMRFVPVKTLEQQSILALHRARQGFVEARTAQANQIRGLLAEFGLILPQGIVHVRERVPNLVDEHRDELPGPFVELISALLDHFRMLDVQARSLEKNIERWAKEQDDCRRLQTVPGLGPITASALVASIGNASAFTSGRQLAAWLGLVPRQHSSGGKNMLLGMSKRGDSYLRTLLIHGARAVIHAIQRRPPAHGWIQSLLGRRHANVAAVALANKNARIVWALLTHGRSYMPGFEPVPMQG